MYIAYFHDDVKSDDGYFMVNCSGCGEGYQKMFRKIQVKIFCDAMEMLCLQKISYMNYITYAVKIKCFSVEKLRGEIRHF